MGNLVNDVHYALRGFRQSPLFFTVAVLSLAFGIGANTAIFSLLDQILLRLLPVKDPNSLVLLTSRGSHYGSNWGGNALSFPMYQDFSANNKVFSGMFCRFPAATSLGYGGRTERVTAELVSGTYFPVLGVAAALGRTIGPGDDIHPGGHPVVVLSHGFWQTRFAGDPSIVGKSLTVNGQNMTIIGVASPGFDGVELGSMTKVFIPIMMKAQITPGWNGLKERRMRWVNVFGRLKPGVGVKEAKASLQPFMHSILEMEVKMPAFRTASEYTRQQFLKSYMDVLPGSQGRSYLRQQLSTPLWLLFGITASVLVLACANLANLLLARASARQREVAIRLAVGASRGNIMRQLLVESLLLSAFGAALGLVLAYFADLVLLRIYLPPDPSQRTFISAAPDLRVLLFTLAVMVFTALLFGLMPALRSSKADVSSTLKEEAGAVVGGGNVVLRKLLVTAQVTLSLLLLIGAGLFLKTLSNLRGLGPGFPTERLIGFNIDPTLSGYSNERAKLFYQRLMDDLATIPGVHATALANMRILEDNEWDSSMTVEGYDAKPGKNPEPYMNAISPGYFAALSVPILAGRDFTKKDVDMVQHGPIADNFSPTVAIINEKFAKKYFAGRNPIGLHIGLGSDPGTKTDMQVVGVVKDIKYTNLRDEIPEQAFLPYLAQRRTSGMTVYLRTTVDPTQLMNEARRRVARLDPNVPVYGMRTTDEQIDKSLRTERLVASLSSVFGALATLLAVIGLYGVMAYTVSRRKREIGIRMALGAIQGRVIWMVMKEVILLVAIGVLIAVPAAVALSGIVRNQLFGLAPHDPVTLASSTVVLVFVACLAGFIPALRASKIHPTQALRYE